MMVMMYINQPKAPWHHRYLTSVTLWRISMMHSTMTAIMHGATTTSMRCVDALETLTAKLRMHSKVMSAR